MRIYDLTKAVDIIYKCKESNTVQLGYLVTNEQASDDSGATRVMISIYHSLDNSNEVQTRRKVTQWSLFGPHNKSTGESVYQFKIIQSANVLCNKPVDPLAVVLAKVHNFACVLVGPEPHDNNIASPDMSQIVVRGEMGMVLIKKNKGMGSVAFAHREATIMDA